MDMGISDIKNPALAELIRRAKAKGCILSRIMLAFAIVASIVMAGG